MVKEIKSSETKMMSGFECYCSRYVDNTKYIGVWVTCGLESRK